MAKDKLVIFRQKLEEALIIGNKQADILVSAKSEDGVIEALEYHEDGNNILGIQYHPEVINDKLPFEWLINKAYERYNK